MAGETLLNFIQNMTTAHLEKQTLLCPFVAPIDRQSFLSHQFFVVFDSVNKIKAIRRERVSEQQDADYSRRSVSLLTEELQTLLNSIHTSISMYLPHLSSYVYLCMLTYLISLSAFFLIFCSITPFSFLFPSLSPVPRTSLIHPSFSFCQSFSFLPFSSPNVLSSHFHFWLFPLYLSRVIFLQKCLFWHFFHYSFLPSIFSSFTCSLCYDRGVGVGFGLINTTASPSSAPLSGSGH